MTSKDLNTVLEVLYKIYGDFKRLFLDEIQNVSGWHLFVSRVLRQGIHVILTGSNAKLLSGELATHLTGRHDKIELLRRNKPLERDVYYFRNADGYEADFVVCKGNKVEGIYQVCYDLSKEKTRSREIRGLLTASNQTRCNNLFLITDFQREGLEQKGKTIKIIPAYKWLIQDV